MNDIRFALRQLLKKPGFTAVAALTLAVGIGANTIVYSWIETVLWNAIPGANEPSELVAVSPMNQYGRTGTAMSYPDLRDLARDTETLAGITGADNALMSLRHDGRSQWVWGQVVLDNFFEVLEIRPAIGQLDFPGTDADIDNAPYAVISFPFWQREFDGDASVVGKAVTLNEKPFTILGVAPEGFKGSMGGLAFDFWIPMSMGESMGLSPGLSDDKRGWHWIKSVARLKDGVTREQAQAEIHTIAAGIAATDPNAGESDTFELMPMWKAPDTGQEIFLPMLRVLMVVALLVLTLVVANIANLMLARSTERHHELGVRLAMGASRMRVLRQLLTESLLLTSLGCVLGIVLAQSGGRILGSFIPNSHLPAGYDVQVSWLVMGLSAGLALLTGVVFGVAPVGQLLRIPLTRLMGDGTRTSDGNKERLLLRRLLVIGQFAIALVLLICAGLCLRSFANTQKLDLGFNPDGVWIAGFRLDAVGYSVADADRFYDDLERELQSLPDVSSVSFAAHLPLGFEEGSGSSFVIEGYQPQEGEMVHAGFERIAPNFFDTMEIPLVDGRDFRKSDDSEGELVAIINKTMAGKYFGGMSPIGREIEIWGDNRRIVGVVGDIKTRELNEPPANVVYAPRAQVGPPNLFAVIRTSDEGRSFAPVVNRVARDLDPAVTVWHSIAFNDFIQPAFLLPNVAATLLGVLGIVALVLAAMGIYAVIAFNVSRRTREIGIRLALGSLRTDIVSMILKQGLRLVAFGFVLGLVLALGVSRLLSGFLLDVSPFDPLTIVIATLILMLVALAGSWIPARRAAGTDPMKALRQE